MSGKLRPRTAIWEKVRNIKEKVSLVKSQFKSVVGNRQMIVVPTMSDEEEGTISGIDRPTMSDKEEGTIFGIDRFRLCLVEILPETAKYHFARTAKLAEKATREILDRLDREADKIIKGAAASAAGVVLVNPVPASDIAVLAPLQVGMIIKLGAIYGKTIDRNSAIEIISTLGAGLAARTVFQGVISLIPGIKNVLGPPYAATATYGIGRAAKAYFKGQGVPSSGELRGEVERELLKPAKIIERQERGVRDMALWPIAVPVAVALWLAKKLYDLWSEDDSPPSLPPPPRRPPLPTRGHFTRDCILVIGRTGAGKSSLINMLKEEDVLPTGDIGSTTRWLEGVSVDLGLRTVTFVDSPGYRRDSYGLRLSQWYQGMVL